MTPVDIDKLKEAVTFLLWQYDRKGPIEDSVEAWEQLRATAPALIAKAERVDALEAALKPFAHIGTLCGDKNATVIGFGHGPDDFVTYEHFRAARNALSPKESEK